jgi:hypothetical protein
MERSSLSIWTAKFLNVQGLLLLLLLPLPQSLAVLLLLFFSTLSVPPLPLLLLLLLPLLPLLPLLLAAAAMLVEATLLSPGAGTATYTYVRYARVNCSTGGWSLPFAFF